MLNRSVFGPVRQSRLQLMGIRFAETEGDGEGAHDDPKPEEPKFPANTPVKDMKPEEQAAYWQDKARKHEDRVKAYGDVTPEKLAQLQKEAETLRKKTLTPDEKVIDDAKEAGRAEIRAVLATERVKNALEKALAGRVPDASALLDLDRSKFVKGDGADLDAIKAWVDEHSTEQPQKKGAPDLGQGRERGNTTADKGVGAGADLFSSKHNKTTTKP